MNIRELPEWEKPREKLLKDGAASLSAMELLAVLIGTGRRGESAMDLASKILSLHPDGIRFLADCTPEELRDVGGIGDAKICILLAAAELGRRIAAAKPGKPDRIESSRDIADLFMEKMRYYRKEHFICLLISAKGDIIEADEVSVGDICSSAAGPREVFVNAIRRNAGSVAFLHNHPSGDPAPSEADIQTTRRLVRTGELLGIPVLDHIVIGDGSYISMKAEGMM